MSVHSVHLKVFTAGLKIGLAHYIFAILTSCVG